MTLRPSRVAVGHALISLTEPQEGKERDYNRWYEDDHFFAGGLFSPWLFSGRRWIATHELRELRYPKNAPTVVDPVTLGCYLTTYWIAPRRRVENQQWLFAANRELTEQQRIYQYRTNVFTAFHDHVGTVYASANTPRDIFSLMDPAPGLVLEVVDAETPEDVATLERWLVDEHLPSLVGGNVSSAMVFRTNAPVAGMGPSVSLADDTVSCGGRRLVILWFLRADPRDLWQAMFAEEGKRIDNSGRGRLALVAPFIPSRMGTNAYDDQLRAPGVSVPAGRP